MSDLIEAASVQCKTMADGSLRITFDVSPTHAQDAFRLFGSRGVQAALARLVMPHEQKAVEQKRPNALAQKMHVDGYFRNVKLWLAVHDSGLWSLQQHKQWVQEQKCCAHAVYPLTCSGDVVAHHADQAGDQAGGRRQPENPQKGLHFYCVPVCHAAHAYIHTKATREEKQEFRLHAISLTAQRMKELMKRWCEIESLAEVTEDMKRGFEEAIGL